ncbi:hypothetical protein [Pseudomonas veronii]|uniref:hypothetical protein n=1 Tax=Pseudomonas veronii TaxID=76761 RepID=UPI000625E890|nr:hypothetical protein [Pseudomonas veronii]
MHLIATSLFQDATPVTARVREPSFDEKVVNAVEVIKSLIRAGKRVVAATSFGKDSSVVLALTLRAMEDLKAEGAEVPELHVLNSDTLVAVDMDVCMDNAWRAECTRPMKLPIHVRMDMIPTWTDVPSVSISCRELRAGCCLQLITRLNAAFIQVGTRDASSILSSILLSEFFNIYINLQRPTIFSERW